MVGEKKFMSVDPSNVESIDAANMAASSNSLSYYSSTISEEPDFRTEKEKSKDAWTYAIPNTLLGGLSEVTESLPGLDEKDAEALVQAFSTEGSYRDFKNKEAGYKLGGALLTSVIPIVGMSKLMKSKTLFKAVEKIGGEKATKVFLPSKSTLNDRVESIREQSLIQARKQGNNVTQEISPELSDALRKASWTEAADMAKIGVATDLGIYGLLNESEFFFPEEMSAIETAAFYAVPNAVFSGVGLAYAKYKLKNVIRDTGELVDKARNAANLPINEVVSRPGQRDSAATIYAAQVGVKNSEIAKTQGDSILAANLNNQANAYGLKITEEIQQMAKDSVYPELTTSFKISQPELNTLNSNLREDYYLLHDVKSIENYTAKSKDFNVAINNLQERFEKKLAENGEKIATLKPGTMRYKKAIQQQEGLKKQIESHEGLVAVKINPDGTMQKLGDAKPIFDEEFTGIRKSADSDNAEKVFGSLKAGDTIKIKDKISNRIMYGAKTKTSSGFETVLVSDDLKLIRDDSKGKLIDLDFKTQTAYQTTMRNAVNEFKISGDGTFNVNLSDDMHHMELDAVLELGAKFGQDNPALKGLVRFNGDTLQNWDSLEFTSIVKKYEDWVTGVEKIGKQANGFLKFGKPQQTTLDDLIISLNLPNDGVFGLHPLMERFVDLQRQGVKNFREAYQGLNDLKVDLLKSVKPQGDILEEYITQPAMKLRGAQLLKFEESRKPVVALIKPTEFNPLFREDLVTQAMQQRTKIIDQLKDGLNQGAALLTGITEVSLRDKARLSVAKKVSELIEGTQLRSDRFTQTMFGLENQGPIKAIDSIRNEIENLTQGYVKEKFDPYTLMFNKLISSKGDLDSFAIAVHQQGLGWRGHPDLVPVIENDKIIGYKIPLEDHKLNRELIEKDFPGMEFPKGADNLFIPNPKINDSTKYEPLVISPTAAEGVLAINTISQDILNHVNHLRKVAGLKAISKKNLHMVPKNLSDKEKVYLINKDTGELDHVASGNTPIQAQTKAKAEVENARNRGINLFIASDEQVSTYKMLKLDEFARMQDYSTTFRQTGAAKGTSFGSKIEIGPEVLRRMQETLINQYTTISRVGTEMLFEPEFRAAEVAALSSGLSSTTLKKGRTVWDSWSRRALGKKSGDEKQTIGKFYGAVEDVYDNLLQKAFDEKLKVFKSGQSVSQAETHFKDLDKATSGYNPFKDSIEFMENTMKIKAPHSMLKHSAKLNAIAGATMLRMFEVGLGLVNIMTLPTLIPVVARGLKRPAEMSLQEWKNSISAWGSTIDDSQALWNPMRASTTGMHFFFSKEGRDIISEAGKKGHLWQKTVEQMQIFTSPSQNYAERMIKEGTDYVSKFVDKTEEWSRGISYATFYKMGKDNLKLPKEEAMEFAHQMANKTIGDFRPNNRPQVFQGAVGMPFGLFTTFAYNYMQRVFGYLEKGQFDTFFYQQGLQASFFGAKSLPGFNQYVDAFSSNYDGTENMVDRLEKGFGTEATDALLFGGVGSLTGLASYTRTDIVLPGSNFARGGDILDQAPVTGMIKKTWQGISEIAESLRVNRGFNDRQISETLARTFPIKAVRGWIEAANGQSVDSRGQLVNENINSAMEIFGKVSSIKPLREQRLVEEFARIRSTSLKQKEVRRESSMMIRSAFRDGNLDSKMMNNIAKRYLKAKGDPAQFNSMLQREMEFALINKGYLKALTNASNPNKHNETLRLLRILGGQD